MTSRPKQPDSRKHVALLVETSLASGRDILRGVASYLRARTPWALFHEPRSLGGTPPDWLSDWHGHGVIARLQDDRIGGFVQSLGIPAVDVLGVARSPDIPLVHVDDAAVAELAASHLVDHGFQHFAFVGIRGENWSERRGDAFLHAADQATTNPAHTTSRARGSSRRPPAVYEVHRSTWHGSDWEYLEDSLADWIRELPKPCGIFASSDQLGPRVLEACRRAGTAVPDEVAVVGVDNDQPLCEVCDPPLSSVAAGHFAVGFEAAALLDRLMDGEPAPARPVLVPPTKVVTRTSSDVLAVDDTVVAAALRFIRHHACSGAGVDEVAAAAAVSRSVLQRRFRSALNRTVHDCLLDSRLKRAQDLLSGTDLTLAEIAELAGFNHQEYLGAVFRTKVGTTPAKFRLEHRTIDPSPPTTTSTTTTA